MVLCRIFSWKWAGPSRRTLFGCLDTIALKNFHGCVQGARLNGFKGDYLVNSGGLNFFDIIERKTGENGNAIYLPNALGIVSNAIRPGDVLLTRFSHNGKRTNEAVGHLEEVICHASS